MANKKKINTPPVAGEAVENAKVAEMEVVDAQEVSAEDPSDKLSPQEKEIIKQNRLRQQLIMSCKEKIDTVLKESKCVLKINPNSPIGAPQIIVDVQ